MVCTGAITAHRAYQALAKHCRAHPSAQRLIGLSGGLDSVALLHLLVELKKHVPFELTALYVHHGLSANADVWLDFCQKLCLSLNVPFMAERVNLGDMQGESIEALARDARYQAFSKHLPASGQLLTAQHQNDQVESFILAAKRGSGVKGLSAMPLIKPFANGSQLRPLLEISRAELAQLAKAQGWQWVEDESNQNTQFDRNFIRAEIIPKLTERWPGVLTAIGRSARLCAEQQTLLTQLLQDELARFQSPQGALQIEPLTQLDPLRRQAILRQWIDTHGYSLPSEVRLKEIWDNIALAREDAQPMLAFKGYQVRRYLGQLYLVKPESSVPAHLIVPLEAVQLNSLPCGQQLKLQPSVQGERIKLPQAPLTVRYQLAGSHKLTPAGRNGSRSYKKLLQEYQVPPWLRAQIPIIFAGEEVIAVGELFICQPWLAQADEAGLSLIWKLPVE
ncbi:tRNA lysidine(34) synthetase TilS [Motilimonas eburnea]|uniref:tRNA lysidine(34) synthetase TilS n=1 Tax=Motilimonas eburnea TaxID=1737488 RepID=UPI001E35B6B5|nr:tRNA lysidine(34) synthetase TilS [Motilimonas eburnea]MCE2571454.1 tRNA lysidine(34) synthetase TilS [Motilimonas eburnea]